MCALCKKTRSSLTVNQLILSLDIHIHPHNKYLAKKSVAQWLKYTMDIDVLGFLSFCFSAVWSHWPRYLTSLGLHSLTYKIRIRTEPFPGDGGTALECKQSPERWLLLSLFFGVGCLLEARDAKVVNEGGNPWLLLNTQVQQESKGQMMSHFTGKSTAQRFSFGRITSFKPVVSCQYC